MASTGIGPETFSTQPGCLRLRRATEADAKQMSDTFFEAFGHMPFTRASLPLDRPTTRPWFEAGMRKDLQRPGEKAWVVVDTSVSAAANDASSTARASSRAGGAEAAQAGQDGLVIAFAQWAEPRVDGTPATDPGHELDGPDEDVCPPGGDVQKTRDFFGTMHTARRELMGHEPHWFLALIATRPSYQRRGAAAMLLREALALADHDGVRAFLVATPVGRKVYNKYGFRDAKALKFSHMHMDEMCMIREKFGKME